MEKNPHQVSLEKLVFLVSLSQIYQFAKFQASSKGNIYAFLPSADSFILVYVFSVLTECAKWGENHDPVFCKWFERFYFSQAKLAQWINVVSIINSLHLRESISPHTKEDLGKKISFHYIFQLFSLYSSVTFLVQLACLFETRVY